MNSHPTLIIFGAFDRHNFGDMLFAHIAERLVKETRPDVRTIVAGLVARDLRGWGGHDVKALASLKENDNAALIHAGGELLTCTAWDAAVMLQRPDDAQACIARHGACVEDRAAFACATLGTDALAPYVIGTDSFARPTSIGFNAVGGIALASCDTNLQREVLNKLGTAKTVSVRDMQTQSILQEANIEARLSPDPVTMIATLFHERIHDHAQRIRKALPHAYLVVQFSADFGDDATLAQLAAQLKAQDKNIVLFRAGAAPWHDNLAVYRRFKTLIQHKQVTIFESLNIWDICALIASSGGYIGSSLHGRIVATAYDLPCINLPHDNGKQQAYTSTWTKQNAETQAQHARAEFETLIADLDP